MKSVGVRADPRWADEGSAYKTVEINPDLQPKNITYGHLLPLNTLWLAEIEREHFFTHLLTRFNDDAKYGKKSHYKLQYTRKNGPYNSKSSNPILQAFMNAYNNHEDLILSPDDIWLLITINYAKYVNSNSELLRHFFVEHEGKKTLTVIEDVCKDENDWTDFFGNMKKEIEKGVKNSSIVNTLISNYSTTTQVESILSFATIMDTFKNYFDYGRFIPACDIRKGEKADPGSPRIRQDPHGSAEILTDPQRSPQIRLNILPLKQHNPVPKTEQSESRNRTIVFPKRNSPVLLLGEFPG
ncbi:unnamed protein product [Didymodactylos carnosus]|uniref:Uncharacterized protein n=1 Tax=Didymodactylos carnosus TaxID=1234261 RepID=A0A815EH82_9BILA|nr:unnamed protein product [Didymodactylos carnosus]CAF4149972.1 unnamed protein product [Didymodactylos carnosus]